jgi:hypothetical protein
MKVKSMVAVAAGIVVMMNSCKTGDPRFPGYEKIENNFIKEHVK